MVLPTRTLAFGRRRAARPVRYASGWRCVVTGTLLLAGSGEFLPTMTEVDVELLKLTPGRPPSVAIVPTAAGQETTVESWINDGVRHFGELGCRAYGVPIVDRAGANDPAYVAALQEADLVYLSGGSPGYLVETLRD